jgi:4-alpha-glucanotransferase
LGPTATAWIDRLVDAGQSWWQTLPLGPTGLGNAPYNSLSSFAGNPLLVSPDRLVEDGLLSRGDCAVESFTESGGFAATPVDYAAVSRFKQHCFERAWATVRGGARSDLHSAFDEFCCVEAHWLDDFALFMALKARHGGACYLDWPAEVVRREPATLAHAQRELAGKIDETRFVQFLFFRQAESLKQYGRAKGVQLMGDLPFYVSADSADVWANPELFLLDEHRRPCFLGGCPPDYFTPLGQFWGNPVYDWDELRQSGYRWWLARLHAALRHVDLLRLDHFRGFVAAWLIPAGSTSAAAGNWVPGPGVDFFATVKESLGGLPLVAEDLGLITSDVRALAEKFHLPGMRVLQFAFDGHPDNPHLPENIIHNSVVYTGTHDNDTTRGWYESLSESAQHGLWRYLKHPAGDSSTVAGELLHLAWHSAAALAITPLQDLLNLDSRARMNVPGQANGNWDWRVSEDQLSITVFESLRKLTSEARRLPPRKQ